jgi:hypothetical protein
VISGVFSTASLYPGLVLAITHTHNKQNQRMMIMGCLNLTPTSWGEEKRKKENEKPESISKHICKSFGATIGVQKKNQDRHQQSTNKDTQPDE